MPEHLPVPAYPSIPARQAAQRELERHQAVEPRPAPRFGQVEFILFGYTRPNGNVEVWGSRQVDCAQIDREWPDLPFDWGRDVPPIAITVSAQVRTLTTAYGDEMADALRALLEAW
jgi:hypothetical protein